jgi:hypothetical protein
MATNDHESASEGVWPTLATQTRDVVIILAAFGVLAGLGVFVVAHYSTAKDAAAILGVLIPPIATIAGTAFGVSQGAKAGAAAGTATARAAQTETQAVRTQSQQALATVGELRSRLDPVLDAAGDRGQSVPNEQLQAAKTSLDSVEQSLRATAAR